MSRTAPVARVGTVSRALARDRLGVPSVLAFVLASIAAMTVCAGVIPTAYAVTGLTGIPFAFIAVAVILALFCPGYMAMSRRIRNSGSFCVRDRRARQGAGRRRRADGPGRL